ncbi:murein transglycosylase A [Conchiformibius steedae]|uniref:peptidoglycan lytic exotransglycosylase n=1 Tax=Conchiformibius steedae TaxID=153493 RepID=A0A3P2A418_9NEIS|nr:MltA domain-containing protein [Conchiformibius steedae]RRD89668.1 murein transglycosylase [Conchiformibius steedae]
MNQKSLWRYACWGAAAAVLSGCFWGGGISRPDTGGGTVAPPVGTAPPEGFVRQGAGGATFRVVSYQHLPEWHGQPFAASLDAFRKSCMKLASRAEWAGVCRQAAATPPDHRAAKAFFERYFTAWQVSQGGKTQGLFTGYYEPVLGGDVRPTARSRFPIYGVPADFVSVPLPPSLKGSRATVRVNPTAPNTGAIMANGAYTADLSKFSPVTNTTHLKGRFEGNRFVPYFTRHQINGGALDGRAPILGYADDPVELFFLHIQGSGRVRTPNGRFLRLGYADKNAHSYVSIGKYMADRGYLPLSQTSMQNIKSWLAANPSRLAEVLGQNPSYVFFRPLEGAPHEGPIGALGVPLSGGFSGAVDRQFITLGAPIFIATTHPDTRQGLNRLIVAQDTGGAIKGAVRVDFFWGYGDAAGQTAGKMKYPGYVWQLLPNGVMP